MKYQVQISYTNPSHEHVSLRRRVESVTRLVEASSENEALNRAANQQRALGFMIKEAKVLQKHAQVSLDPEKETKKKKVVGNDNETTDVGAAGVKEEKGGTESYPLLKKGEKLKPMKLNMEEGFDTDPKDIAAYLVDRHGKGKVTMDHIEAYERRRDSHRPIEKHEVMKHVKKMSEEVEQIDELKKSTLASYVNKAANQVRAKSGIAASFETQGTRKRNPENKSAYMDVAKDFRQGAKKRLTGIEKATAKLAKEEVELDEAAKDWKKAFQKVAAKNYEKDVAAVRSSANRLDKATQSFPAKPDTKPTDSNIDYVTQKVRKGITKPHSMQEEVGADKRVAGYKMSPAVRAAQKKSDELSKVEKKPQAGTLAAQKSRKAAEKMVNRAKTVVNKINMSPEIEPGKPNA
jgi:hypothetical protein